MQATMVQVAVVAVLCMAAAYSLPVPDFANATAGEELQHQDASPDLNDQNPLISRQGNITEPRSSVTGGHNETEQKPSIGGLILKLSELSDIMIGNLLDDIGKKTDSDAKFTSYERLINASFLFFDIQHKFDKVDNLYNSSYITKWSDAVKDWMKGVPGLVETFEFVQNINKTQLKPQVVLEAAARLVNKTALRNIDPANVSLSDIKSILNMSKISEQNVSDLYSNMTTSLMYFRVWVKEILLLDCPAKDGTKSPRSELTVEELADEVSRRIMEFFAKEDGSFLRSKRTIINMNDWIDVDFLEKLYALFRSLLSEEEELLTYSTDILEDIIQNHKDRKLHTQRTKRYAVNDTEISETEGGSLQTDKTEISETERENLSAEKVQSRKKRFSGFPILDWGSIGGIDNIIGMFKRVTLYNIVGNFFTAVFEVFYSHYSEIRMAALTQRYKEIYLSNKTRDEQEESRRYRRDLLAAISNDNLQSQSSTGETPQSLYKMSSYVDELGSEAASTFVVPSEET